MYCLMTYEDGGETTARHFRSLKMLKQWAAQDADEELEWKREDDASEVIFAPFQHGSYQAFPVTFEDDATPEEHTNFDNPASTDLAP